MVEPPMTGTRVFCSAALPDISYDPDTGLDLPTSLFIRQKKRKKNVPPLRAVGVTAPE